jgi:hypothetical protein
MSGMPANILRKRATKGIERNSAVADDANTTGFDERRSSWPSVG